MTLRIKPPDGTHRITFGAGCNETRSVDSEGLVECPRDDECLCHALAEAADCLLIEIQPPSEAARPVHEAEIEAGAEEAPKPKPRRRRTRKPKA